MSDVGHGTTAGSDMPRACARELAQGATALRPLNGGEPDVAIYAPLDETMRVVDEQMAKWKTTLDWLAER